MSPADLAHKIALKYELTWRAQVSLEAAITNNLILEGFDKLDKIESFLEEFLEELDFIDVEEKSTEPSP